MNADPPDTLSPRTHVELQTARSATIDLFGLMLSLDLDFQTSNRMPDPAWPVPVKLAYQQWVTQFNDVAIALAVGDGIAAGTRLSDEDRSALTKRAYALVVDTGAV